MKAPATTSDRASQQPSPATQVPRQSAIDAGPAANDDFARRKRRTPINPLWAINVAMAAFFIVAALVLMTS